MPILTTGIRAQGTDKKTGKPVAIPPNIALAQRGPLLQVSINVAQAVATQITQQGGQLPTPESGLALIDTGASVTCIDDAVAKKLNLPVVDVINVASASHSSTKQNVYPIQFDIAGLPINVDAPRAIGAPLAAQGLIALIGRDVLQHCTLHYNGLSGDITLSI